MKAKYLVSITAYERQFEFETVIERGDRISDEELNAVLAPEAYRYLESIEKGLPSGQRKGFTSLSYDFLEVVEW